MNVLNVIGGKPFTNLTDTIIPKKDSKSAVIAQKGHPLITASSLRNEERQKCEVWSRVMGYHRPIAGYNIGKKQEFSERKNFKEPKGE